ncbi:MAG TPA: NAD(P)-dependent oxidoreductase [Mycobacteriales bacterium]|nr:NAD(P)-dependent oxidoreductase [Mycobacteriales bacterium]
MAVPTGFIGLGLMGTPMAGNLARAGFPLTVWNRTRDKMESLAEAGARIASRPREVGAASEVVITVLSDDAAVGEVLLGAEGVAQGMAAGGVVMDMSTTSPRAVRELAGRLAERGIGFVDAPFFGSVKPAETGELWVTVGAEESDLDRVRPHLDALCSKMFHMGPVGAGAVMKLCGNLIDTGMQSLLAEGLTLGRRNGLDAGQMLDVLQVTDCASLVFGVKGAQITADDYEPRFPLKHALKDVRMALDMAGAAGLDLRVADGVRADLDSAARAGHADEDSIAVIKGVGSHQATP